MYASLATNALAGAIRMIASGELISPLMAAGVLFTLYPNFYSFFMLFNYFNDRHYDMLYTQVRARGLPCVNR